MLFKPNFKPTTKATIIQQIKYLNTIKGIKVEKLPNSIKVEMSKETRLLPRYTLIFSKTKTTRYSKPKIIFYYNNKIIKDNGRIGIPHIFTWGCCLGNISSLMTRLRLSSDIVGMTFLMRRYLMSCLMDVNSKYRERILRRLD